ncbi:MAG TPA: hypothetical protein VF721_07150 [Pyrinomonadaceae bacterium]
MYLPCAGSGALDCFCLADILSPRGFLFPGFGRAAISLQLVKIRMSEHRG